MKHQRQDLKRESAIVQNWLDQVHGMRRDKLELVPLPIGKKIQDIRQAFDICFDKIHYAGSCKRVGRCMRLLVVNHGKWVGGIILGSTFANIDVRDAALGLKAHIKGYQLRNLRSPWARENIAYWKRLQKVVNHARTFIFPEFQGHGLGIHAHRLLITQGKQQWEKRYRDRVAAFDTLCDAKDSNLFLRNGWTHVGQTAGFESNPRKKLVPINKNNIHLKNNVALRKAKRKWEVWIRLIDGSAFELQ